MEQRRPKKRHRAIKIYALWALLVVLVNLAAAVVPGLGDWYIRHIFPVWVNTYGRFMDLFTFSVGEWMLAAGAARVCVALGLGLFSLIWGWRPWGAELAGRSVPLPGFPPVFPAGSGAIICFLPGLCWRCAPL